MVFNNLFSSNYKKRLNYLSKLFDVDTSVIEAALLETFKTDKKVNLSMYSDNSIKQILIQYFKNH